MAASAWSLSQAGATSLLSVGELYGAAGELDGAAGGHMLVGTLTMQQNKLHFADSTGSVPCVLGCAPPDVWVGANYVAVDKWSVIKDHRQPPTLEIGQIHCCGAQTTVRPPVERWRFERGTLVEAGRGTVPDPKSKRQAFGIQGKLMAVSPLCSAKATDTSSATQLVSFFLATVAEPEDQRLTVQLVFQGAQACCWHSYLAVGGYYCFDRLVHTTLFKNSPGSIRVLAATGAPPGSKGKGTQVHRVHQLSSTGPPAAKRLCCSQLLVQYEGVITAVHGWGLFTLDAKLLLLLGAAMLATITSYVRVGARVRVSNAHKLYDQRGVQVAVGCCMRSHLQLIRPGSSSPHQRKANRSDWLRLVKHMPLSGSLWIRRVHDHLANWLLDMSDTLICQTAMLQQLAAACGVPQDKRDVYQEFVSHERCCIDAQPASAAPSVAVQPVNQLLQSPLLLLAMRGQRREELLSTQLHSDWQQVAVLGKLAGCPLTGGLLLRCADATIQLELAEGATVSALDQWCVVVGFTLVVEPKLSQLPTLVALGTNLKLLPTTSSLGVSPKPTVVLNKMPRRTTFRIQFVLARKGRVLDGGFSGTLQPVADCAALGMQQGVLFTVKFVQLRGYGVLRAGSAYICDMWHAGDIVEASTPEPCDCPAACLPPEAPLDSLSSALCCTMAELRAGGPVSFVCSVVRLLHYAQQQLMIHCTDHTTELGQIALLCLASQLPHFSIRPGCLLEIRGVFRSLSVSHRLIFKVGEHTDIRVVKLAAAAIPPQLPAGSLLRCLYSSEVARFDVQVSDCSVVSLVKFSAKLHCSSCDTSWHCQGRCCDNMKLEACYSAAVLVSDGSAQVQCSLPHELVLQVVGAPTAQRSVLELGLRSCSKLPIEWHRDSAAECSSVLSRFLQHAQLMRSMSLVFQPSLLNTRLDHHQITRFNLEKGSNYETHTLPTIQVDGLQVHAREAKEMARDLVALLQKQ